MSTSIPQDKSICPLCGAKNHCVMNLEAEVDISDCWCSRVLINSERLKNYLKEIGKSEIDQSCICSECTQKFS